MSRAAVRAKNVERKERAREYDSRDLIVTLYNLLGIRNKIIARLDAHLTAEERRSLGYPSR